MSDPSPLARYLEAEIDALEPLDFVAVSPQRDPLRMLEVGRSEDGGSLEIRVPGRPPVAPELAAEVRSALGDRGFASEDGTDRTKPWSKQVDDATSAVRAVQEVMTEVLGQKPDVRLDVLHGSHKETREAQRKLEALRAHLRALIDDIHDGPCDCDEDGDFTLPVADVHVTIAARVIPMGVAVVRVFCITNVGVPPTPELGLFLARLNFGLLFGRFALDAEHNAIWFDETLLGEQLTKESLDFALKVVATTADEWDDRLKEMFGGATHQDVLAKRAAGDVPTVKPGAGGYL